MTTSPDIREFLSALGDAGRSAATSASNSTDTRAARRRFGERFKALRLARGWSRADLAGRVQNVRATTIATIEAGYSLQGGRRNGVLAKLAAVLGTTVEALSSAAEQGQEAA